MLAEEFKDTAASSGTQSPRARPGAWKSFKLAKITQPREEAPSRRATGFLRRLAFNWLQVASALSAACQGQGAPFMSSPTPPSSAVPSARYRSICAGGCSLAFWSHRMRIAGPLVTHSISLKSMNSSGPSFVTLTPEETLMGAQPTPHAYPNCETGHRLPACHTSPMKRSIVFCSQGDRDSVHPCRPGL